MARSVGHAVKGAIKESPVVGPAAVAVARRVPTLRAVRMWPTQARWWLDAVRNSHLGGAPRRAIIVTGCDSSHFRSQINMLRSASLHEHGTEVSFWDLGLAVLERDQLAGEFPHVQVTRFPYEEFPAYFRIDNHAGQYAWKPVIVEREVMRHPDAIIIWLDAGCVIDRRLTWMRRFAHARGFYSPESDGTVSRWTHPGTLAALNADESLLDEPNLNGAVVAVDASNQCGHDVVRDWARCARAEPCIAPAGSSRANHRQDQAVLTVLAHQSGLAPHGPHAWLSPQVGVLTHQDVE